MHTQKGYRDEGKKQYGSHQCEGTCDRTAKAMLYDTDTGKFDVKSRAYTGNYEDVTMHRADNVYEQMIALGREVAAGHEISMIL